MGSFVKLRNGLKLVMELSKIRITIAVTLTTVTGYVMAGRSYDQGFILPAIGIFLLACGASVINHIQERRTDALMERTMKRPVPSYKISLILAVLLAVIEIGAGTAILIAYSSCRILMLGYLAIVCYNIMYINLKKVTPHAVIPGSLVGTIPPLMGWMVAGGSILNIHVLIMSAFFFVWQVPHFYLLSLKYGSQYETAGFPTLQQKMTAKGIHGMIFIWIVLTAVSGLMLLIGGFLRSPLSIILIPAGSVWILLSCIKILKAHSSPLDYSRYFMRINIYFLACVLLMISDPFMEKIFILIM